MRAQLQIMLWNTVDMLSYPGGEVEIEGSPRPGGLYTATEFHPPGWNARHDTGLYQQPIA